MSGYSAHGLIPVLHLDGGEGNINYISVRSVLGHLDPVPLPHHIIGGQLNTGNQTKNHVFKNEQENRSQGSQTGKEINRGFIQQYGKDENNSRSID